MTDVEFITDFDEGQYCYALGFDGDKAKNYCIDYFAYLMSQGFSIDDVTDMVGQEGSVAYFIKENDVIVGNIAVTYIDDIGFIMAIWWD